MSNEKVCIINQPAGLGDILWIQPIVDDISNRGFKVLYPVCEQYLQPLKDRVTTRNSNFCSVEDVEKYDVWGGREPVIEDDFEYWPFDHIWNRPELSQYDVMEKKYRFYQDVTGREVECDWQNSVFLDRNKEGEDKYYEQLVGGEERYIWVNNTYGTPPNTAVRPMEIQWDGHVVVNNGDIPIFDTLKIIENAEQVHTVETSFCYLIDLLNTKTDDINMYSRKTSTCEVVGLEYTDKLFSREWRKHV